MASEPKREALLSVPTARVLPAAFDLVAMPDGARLVYARAGGGAAGGLIVQELDARGSARGPERRLAATGDVEVTEIAAASGGGDRLGVVWTEQDSVMLYTRGLLARLDAVWQSKPALLAQVHATPGASPLQRGRIAAFSAGGPRIRAMYAAGASRCADSDAARCEGFGMRELDQPAAADSTPWLSVPEPCAAGAAAIGALEGRFYYAVCSRATGSEQTIAYSLNLETEYARADPVLAGCVPLGMSAIDSATLLLGADCRGVRRAAKLTQDVGPATELALSDAALECDGDRTTLRSSAWGLPLDVARERLEPILPPALAPIGSRAVSTGRSLLVASAREGWLSLTRTYCENGVLRSEASARPAQIP